MQQPYNTQTTEDKNQKHSDTPVTFKQSQDHHTYTGDIDPKQVIIMQSLKGLVQEKGKVFLFFSNKCAHFLP